MKTLIKNGMILTTENEFKSDILIVDEKIAAIGKNLSEEGVDKIIDAEGKFVFPGGIDQHVHYSFVYQGSKVRGFETSNAPALGGTTTVIEFVNQVQGKGLLESIDEFKMKDVDGIAMVDYGFHIVMTDPRPEVIEEIPKLAEAGYPTLKLFMAYKGQFFHADDDAIIQALTKGKEAGITVMVHAENGDIVDFLTKKLIAEGKTGTYYHAVSRPPVCEAEATRRAIYLAEMANAPIYIVHVTCKEALDEIRAAYQRGQSVYGETCAHYLLFDESVLDQPNFEGAKYICSPALRTKDHQEPLWEALNKGWLNAVSSDHCGFDFAVQKHMGYGEGKSFADVPNGAPSVQNRVNAVWTYGVCEGKLSRQEFVNVIAASPARVNGLTEKGHIAVGYDADIVVFDPEYRGIMGVANSLEGVDYSIYEGMEQKGRPETVLLRGQVIVENAEYVGKKGQGKLAKGKPFGSAYDKFEKA